MPPNRPEHIVDGDRAAIVPGRIVTDIQGIDEAVIAEIPGGSQARHQIGGGIGLDKIVVEGVQDGDFAIAGGRARIECGRGQPSHAQRAAVLGADDAAQGRKSDRADSGRGAGGKDIQKLATGNFACRGGNFILHD